MEKKRLLLRIDPALHDDLRVWAEDEFRSINAQIEFLLKNAVRKRKHPAKKRTETTSILGDLGSFGPSVR